MMTSTTPPLRGEALHAVLDRAWELLDPVDEDDVPKISAAERQARAIDLLHRHTFAPVNLDELGYLHGMWLTLEQPETATTVLHQHRAAVLAAEGADATTALALELMELTSRWHLDPGGGQDRLAAVLAQLHTHAAALETLEDQWESLAIQYHAWELLDAHIEWKHRQSLDGVSAAWRDVMLYTKKAELAVQRGDQAGADQHIRAVINRQAEASGGEDINKAMDNWETTSRHVLSIAPREMDTLVQAARATLHAITPALHPSMQLQWNTRFARWQAHACAKLEQWEQALCHARQGHHLLAGEAYNSDAFGAHMLDWLVKAGRMAEAAELAWRGIWTAPWDGMAVRAYELALDMWDKDIGTPAWDWILASAHYRNGLLYQCEAGQTALLAHLNSPLPLPASAYLERARQIAPDHPAPDLIEGVHLAQQEQWQAALPLLERGVLALPDLAEPLSVSLLWCARFKCLPEDEAIQRPFAHSHGAAWAGDLGRDLVYGKSTELSRISAICGDTHTGNTRERRHALGMRYLESARARHEAFFATGVGNYAEGTPRGYSALCQWICIQYQKQGRIDEAMAVIQAGLASKPLVHHYANLMICWDSKQNYPAVLALAEPFWHDSQSDVDGWVLTSCAANIARALHREQRHHEISIWMDRIDQWWQGANAHDQYPPSRCRGDYLAALLIFLRAYSIEYPQLAKPVVQQHLPEILALDSDSEGATYLTSIWFNAAVTLQYCGSFSEAITLYQKVLARAQAEGDTDRVDEIRPLLSLCQKLHAAVQRHTSPRKFWQFWK